MSKEPADWFDYLSMSVWKKVVPGCFVCDQGGAGSCCSFVPLCFSIKLIDFEWGKSVLPGEAIDVLVVRAGCFYVECLRGGPWRWGDPHNKKWTKPRPLFACQKERDSFQNHWPVWPVISSLPSGIVLVTCPQHPIESRAASLGHNR